MLSPCRAILLIQDDLKERRENWSSSRLDLGHVGVDQVADAHPEEGKPVGRRIYDSVKARQFMDVSAAELRSNSIFRLKRSMRSLARPASFRTGKGYKVVNDD
jgi:hypothetical protein